MESKAEKGGEEKRGRGNSLVVCDESGHTKFPFSFVVLSWGELWLICPELSLYFPDVG